MARAADAQVGLLGRQVDRRQLVQAHHVVGDDDLGRHLGDAPAGLVDGRLGVGDGVVRRRPPASGVDVGFVAHVCYPSWGNSGEAGATPTWPPPRSGVASASRSNG